VKRPVAYIAGTGRAVPRQVVTNHDLEARGLDTNDAWIVERTGIRQRYIAGDGESTRSMAAEAARKAMAKAGVSAGELDLIVVGTATPDRLLPSAACDIQAELGATRAGAFDVSAACSGFVYGCLVAEGMLATGTSQTALVIGVEKLSAILNWEDRNTAILFGDGAGAAILRRSRGANAGKGILSTYLRSDGTLAELLWRPSGGAERPFSPEVLADRSQFIQMSGREVFKHAVRSMAEATDRALDGAKLTAKDIDLIIPHQANVRIIEATAKHAGVSMDKVYVNVDAYGNTSAASVPIALDEAMQTGRLREGMTALLVAFGAGFTWGSMVVRF
jgi:3-oxoacyl-[acyl-carrier-protein] synthase-3